VGQVVWNAVWEDLRQLENSGDNAQSLLTQPLWLVSAPKYVGDDWRNLSVRLLGRADENWSVWIDWYEARLIGCVELLERNEIARVSLPNEVWAQGPAVANARISNLAQECDARPRWQERSST
jgi:hypothetical protein